MRVALGRIALLLGVAVVAVMAWYGATTLFDESGSDDDPDAECDPGSRSDARAAGRAFLEQYGDQRWLVSVQPTRVQRNAWGLMVTEKKSSAASGLPECIEGVPVGYRDRQPRRGA